MDILVYLLNNTEGVTELAVLADDIKQKDEWVLALRNDMVVGGVKTEYLKGFYLTSSI